jgi:hypothetical protein
MKGTRMSKAPKLHIPEGVTESGMIDNMDDAIKRASLCMPAIGQEIVDVLSDISLSLYWIEKYLFLKLQSENLLSPEVIAERDEQMESDDKERPDEPGVG